MIIWSIDKCILVVAFGESGYAPVLKMRRGLKLLKLETQMMSYYANLQRYSNIMLLSSA